MSNRQPIWTFLGIAAAVVLVSNGYAAIINVPGDQATIQLGINAAVNGDEIVVAPGTYFEVIDFIGKAITVRSSDGPHVTIIDAQGAGRVVTCVSGEGGDTVLEGFTITGGNAFNAGGMLNGGSSPTVRNCTFSQNSGCNGGGMQNSGGGSATIVLCTFIHNSACNGGGIQNIGGSSPTVIDCMFIENTASQGGGMLFTQGAVATVSNCIFIGNTATFGGGLWTCCNASPTVINCSFVGNSASANGGGIRTRDSGSSSTITNCVVWDNNPDQIIDLSGAMSTVAFSNVEAGWFGAGGNNIDADPLFIDANGPDGMPGTEDDDLHLSPGSPCIDAGDNTAVPKGITTDLDGNPRFVDDPDTDDTGNGDPPIVDMGAYEFQLQDADGDGIPDDEDACPDSDLADTIVIDGCDSGVFNLLFDDGCTMADLIAECTDGASNHGDFVSCVAHLTNEWKHAGLITGREKGAIQRCAAQSTIPGGLSLVSGRGVAGGGGLCPADINGDGVANVLDLIDLLLCFGLPAIPGCVGEDINEDGMVNVLDLIGLLLAFGTACP